MVLSSLAPAASAENLFAPASEINVGASPTTIAVGDFNSDGAADLAVSNSSSGYVSILLGTGTGTFNTAHTYDTGNGPYGLAVGDVNGDGKLDFAVSNEVSNTVVVLLGDETGAFTAATSAATGPAPRGIAVADLTGDGRLDLVVANHGANTISVFVVGGNGSLDTRSDFVVSSGPQALATADLNGDLRPDLVVTSSDSPGVAVLLNQGNGSLNAASFYSTTGTSQGLALADFNADGRTDLVVTQPNQNSVSVRLGMGNGTFGESDDYSTGPRPVAVVAGDVDGDGIRDLAIADGNGGAVSVLLGGANGTFHARSDYVVGLGPADLVIARLNDDLLADIATVNLGANSVSVLLGRAQGPHLTAVPTALVFGTAFVGHADSLALRLGNSGSVSLNVTAIATGSPEFTVSGAPAFTIPSDGSHDIKIRYVRASAGNPQEMLTISSNDANSPVVHVPLSGTAIQPPALAASPQTVNLAAASGDSATTSLVVHNTGLGVLIWTLSTLPPVASWISFTPAGGTLGPGSSATVSIRGSALGLNAGVFPATLRVSGNDPVTPIVDVAVRFSVNGTPRITAVPGALAFGSDFQGSPDTLAVRISDVGTDSLRVSSVEVSGSEFQGLDSGAFRLAPSGYRDVRVRNVRGSIGPATGAMTFVSDDPITPSLNVPLSSMTVGPPVVSVAPDSFAVSLASGDSTSRLLTIRNLGASQLTYQIGRSIPLQAMVANLENLNPLAGDAARDSLFTEGDPIVRANSAPGVRAMPKGLPSVVTAAPAVGSVLVIGDGGSESDIGAVLSAAGYSPTYVQDDALWDGTNPSAQGFNLVVLLDGVSFGNDMPTSGQTALLNYVNNGGGLILTEWISWEVSRGRYQFMLPLIPVTRSAGGTGIFTHAVVANHPVTAGVSPTFHVSSGMGIGTLNSGTALVNMSDGAPAVVAKQYGRGRLVYFAHAGNYFGFHPFLVTDMQRLIANAASWSSGSVWLSAGTSSGVVDPGQIAYVDIGFSARAVPAGVYRDFVRVSSNDPIRSEVTVPARLAVSIAPVIVVQPAALDFGSKPLGVPETLEVQIRNVGSDVLRVSGMTLTSPEFEILDLTTFTLAVGERKDVRVRMVRGNVGTFAGEVVIASNDPTHPSVTVALTGVCVYPPLLTVTPTSVDLAAMSRDSTQALLTIGNSGLGPLTYAFAPPGAPWLSFAPGLGTVAPGAQQAVTVRASAAALYAGAYVDTLHLTTNDPNPSRSMVRIPTRFMVSGIPAISVASDTLRFDNAWVGLPGTIALIIRNTGTDSLRFSSAIVTNPRFILLDAVPPALGPGQELSVRVQFTPVSEGGDTGDIEIVSNDTLHATIHVRLEGTARQPSRVRLLPTSLGFSLNQDALIDLPLTLFNDGLGPLVFSVTGIPAWLSISSSSGTVAPQSSLALAVHANATNLAPGPYAAGPVFSTNDPLDPSISFPISMQVDGIPPGPPVAEAPQNGQINVSVRPTLRWHAAARALHYDVYLWKSADPEPVTSTFPGLTLTSYSVSAPLTTGIEYRWRVVAVDASGSTGGVTQSFTTETLPDLVVTLVETPPTAFSGQPISVRHVVTNQGENGTNVPEWTDYVYFSPTPTFDPVIAILEATPTNPAFLAPGESYSVVSTFTLPQGIVGSYYVFIDADARGVVLESRDDNNRGRCVAAIQVNLTPPPNLVVPSVNGPTEAFSGESVPVAWSVRNDGTGGTRVGTWVDAVYLSLDQNLNTATDANIGSTVHSGALEPGQSYTASLPVTLPQKISGNYWLIVLTDASNAVYENVFEGDNWTTSSPLLVILTPPPDFVVDDVHGPAAALSGKSLEVEWTVRNAGAGEPFETSWYDAVYLSQSPTFDVGSSRLLGNGLRYGPLPNDATYTTQRSFTLPVDIVGSYYLYVETDVGNLVFENGLDSNNRGRSVGTTEVLLSPPPDLVPTQVQTSSTGRAGDALAVTWTVRNNGTGPTLASFWTDRVDLVLGDTWDQAQVVATRDIQHGGTLQPQGSYTSNSALTPPPGTSGTMRVWVTADVFNQVFEHQVEGNNQMSSGPVAIAPILPSDLVAASVTAPAAAAPGQSIVVSWIVRNDGPRATYATSWIDEVYLSSDATFDASVDRFLTSATQGYALGVGAAYSRSVGVTLPGDLEGDFYLFVVPDRAGVVLDAHPENNATSVHVTFVPPAPAADLIVPVVSAPPQATAGQIVTVSWTVQNNGPGATSAGLWYDAIYLSGDPTLDGGDARIASLQHVGALGPGGSYNPSLGVEIPAYVGGSYYLLAVADSRNDVDERSSEGNNVAGTTIRILVSPPCDLIVSDVTAPPAAIPGENVTVSWTLHNIGANRVTGSLRDGVYLSNDATWDIDDGVIGLLDHYIDILPGSAMTMSAVVNLAHVVHATPTGDITAPLPGVTPGTYRMLIRTDLRNVIHESDETNNLAVAAAATDVDIAQLQLGMQVSRSVSGGQSVFYKVDVTAGLDLEFDLSGGNPSRWGEVYVAYARVPSLNDFDYAGAVPFSASQHILLPGTQAGGYYVMVLGRGVGVIPATLLVRSLAFQIQQVLPAVGGAGGKVTGHITGAGFQNGIRAMLRSSGGTEYAAGSVTRLSNSDCRVVWDLKNVPLGEYDVLLMNPDASSANIVSGFTVEERTPYRILTTQNAPAVLRAGSSAVFALQFENVSNVDVPYVLVTIELPGSQEVRVVSDRLVALSHFVDPGGVSGQPDFYDVQGTRYIPLLAQDMTIGEIIQCTVAVIGPRTGRVPIRVHAVGMGSTAFAVAVVTNIEQVRQKILEAPELFDPSLVLLAHGPADFRNAMLQPFYERGLIQRAFAEAIVPSPPAPGAIPGKQVANGCHETVTWIGCGVSAIGCVGFLLGGALSGIGLFLGIGGCAVGLSTNCFLEPRGYLDDAGPIFTVGGLSIDLASIILEGSKLDLATLAADATLTVVDQFVCTRIVRASDPNDIQGPTGVGDGHWVAVSARLPYVIHIENDSTHATAPTRLVSIRQPLDDAADARTFRLGRFGLGTRVFDVPANRAYYSQRLDLRDSLGVYVDVSAGIDVTSREAFWVFRAIDPATGQPPENPLIGLLPVNDASHRGEGFVNYTIKPIDTAQTGDSLVAKASIVFDNNDPIDTPEFVNLIDARPPGSQVRALPIKVEDLRFKVRWAGADDAGGSGLRSYDVYARRGSDPYVLWQSGTPDTIAIYEGVDNETYAFYSVAMDNVGLREVAPTTPDAVTTVHLARTSADPAPAILALYRATPNPSTADLPVVFSLPSNGPATLEVFDVAGRRIVSRQVRDLGPGQHVVRLGDATAIRSGIYFIRLSSAGRRLTQKTVVIR